MSHVRCLLHRNQVKEFVLWLGFNNWSILLPTGAYDAVRAKRGRQNFIAYDRNGGDHLSVQADMQWVVRDFLRFKREQAKRKAA